MFSITAIPVPEMQVEEICFLAALVYLKTVYDFHLYLQIWGRPASATIDEEMIQGIEKCFGTVQLHNSQIGALSLWFLFLGGAAISGTKDRA